jgi:MFS family permease
MASPKTSARGLDWLNFFVADVQTGFGPFVSVYLAEQKWTQLQIGVALTIGTAVSLIAQVPAGALVDAVRSKRLVVAAGVGAVTLSALLLALAPGRLPVAFAEVLHGGASCIIGPGIAAISLRLAGRKMLGERLGRNARFAAMGTGIAAGVMGVIGSAVGSQSVFWLTAALGVPALIALSTISPAPTSHRIRVAKPFDVAGIQELLTDRRLVAFGVCALLFHLSNAAMLPLAAAQVTKQAGSSANLFIAACIVVPQAVVAAISPLVGRLASSLGRKPLLLLGWGSLPVRGVLMAAFPGPAALVAAQTIGGISAAVFGVLLPLIAADVTARSGRLNLAIGLVGLPIYVGAALSTSIGGAIATDAGTSMAFLVLAAIGLGGTAMIGLGMPETRPADEWLRVKARRSPSPAA